MKEFLTMACILTTSITLFANRQMISPDDAVKIGIVTDILWKDTPVVSEDDSKVLLETVRYPHDDVASYAISAAIARNPANIKEILTVASESQNSNCKEIALYAFKIGDKDLINKIMDKLTNQKLVSRRGSHLEKNIRDVLVYSLLIQAREKKISVVIPKNIEFTWGQRMLLKFADKPESQAWEYLFPQLAEQQRNTDASFAIIFALSAYSKVFFDEAITNINNANTSKLTRDILIDYLLYNQYRLNEDQLKKLKILKQGSSGKVVSEVLRTFDSD